MISITDFVNASELPFFGDTKAVLTLVLQSICPSSTINGSIHLAQFPWILHWKRSPRIVIQRPLQHIPCCTEYGLGPMILILNRIPLVITVLLPHSCTQHTAQQTPPPHLHKEKCPHAFIAFKAQAARLAVSYLF
jgi:hypothetical protein